MRRQVSKKRGHSYISNQYAAAESRQMIYTLAFAMFAPDVWLFFLPHGLVLSARLRTHLPGASILLGWKV